MTVFEKLKILANLNSTVNEIKKGFSMKDSTKVVLAVITFLTGLFQVKSIQDSLVACITSHPALALALGGISAILGILHVPTKTIVPIFLIAALLMAPGAILAQDVAPVQSIYAAGVSYSVGGSPSLAGTGLYAHQLSDSGTYAFTVVDALPNTVKPVTVSTNFGIGVAQKVARLGKIDIFMPTAVGISWTGQNTGFQWNGGAIAAIKLKGNYYLMPSARFLKSSVSNGTGYQPILGLLVGWGQ